jgi:hypothetical protein
MDFAWQGRQFVNQTFVTEDEDDIEDVHQLLQMSDNESENLPL